MRRAVLLHWCEYEPLGKLWLQDGVCTVSRTTPLVFCHKKSLEPLMSDSPHVLNRSPWSRHKRRGWSMKERGRGAGNTSFLSHGPWKASLLGNYWCYCHEGRAQNGQGSITVSAARGGGLIREGWQDAVEGVWRPLRFIKVMAYVFVKVHLPSRVKPERGNMLFFSLQGFKALIYSWWSYFLFA